MSFDAIAPHYRWMEFLSAGESLQRCRTAFLHKAPTARNVLILGEGNGRFLSSFLAANTSANVVCVDDSARMLSLARDRVLRKGLSVERVEFVHEDILAWNPASGVFDLVVTHFFLDCFPPEPLGRIVRKVAAATAPRACWLIADFQEAERGLARWRSRVILQVMYTFFRAVTALPARQLAMPDAFLAEAGFRLIDRRTAEWGLLKSDLWQRD